jgi:quercetin dioxygenase-like cupin family protein
VFDILLFLCLDTTINYQGKQMCETNSSIEIITANFRTAADTIQITPDVTGVELNDPSQFHPSTNEISIARLSMNPNAGFERHVHPHNHVLVILKGSGFLTYDSGNGDKVLEFGEGEVFNVPGTSEHAVSAGADGIDMLTIGSPSMQLIDPERMVFIDDTLKWMVPQILSDTGGERPQDA